MAAVNKGLGRGLDALLKGMQEGVHLPEVLLLSVDNIRPNPYQPRQEFTPEALRELAESIKSQGVLQPIMVRPLSDDDKYDYELVAGERRWRATSLAGLSEIPALVREVSDNDSLAIALIENLQREDLNPLDEAKGISRLMQMLKLSQEEAASKVGKSRSAVANCLRLLQLPTLIQEDIKLRALSAGHARALLSISDPQTQNVLRERILERGHSVREVEDMAAFWREHGRLPDSVVPQEQSEPSKRAPRPPLEESLRQAKQSLQNIFGGKISLSGTASRGKITFHYQSEEEFQQLLEKLGN